MHNLPIPPSPPERGHDDPIVVDALDVLRPFYLPTRFEAAKLLAKWVRYDELDAGQIRRILNCYRSSGAAPTVKEES